MTAADLLHDLRAQGFELRTDGVNLWVTPRARLTDSQAGLIAFYKTDLISLVSNDPEVIRRRLVETLRRVDQLADEAVALFDRCQRIGERFAAESRAATSTWRGGEGIPPDVLNTLVRLAHPDRHGNSPAANRATTWLLQQRGRLDS
jgi:hypothetical protein